MRRGLTNQLIEAVQGLLRVPAKRTGRGAASKSGRTSAGDVRDTAFQFEYSPRMDGDPDPGEVVWTWVPYEDDPRQGKDRPVAIIGRRGDHLLGVPLTSKVPSSSQLAAQMQVPVGTGSWDREGRPSYAKVERLLDVVPDAVRREGAVLSRRHFDDIVRAVERAHRRGR